MPDLEHAIQIAGALHAGLSQVTFPVTPFVQSKVRLQVCEYTDELKALGVRPERVIIAVKRVAREAGIVSESLVVPTSQPRDGKDKLLVDLVSWCIEQYYDRPENAN